jgi:hypothetical protein
MVLSHSIKTGNILSVSDITNVTALWISGDFSLQRHISEVLVMGLGLVLKC